MNLPLNSRWLRLSVFLLIAIVLLPPAQTRASSEKHLILGITLQSVTAQISKSFGLPDSNGAFVADVDSGSRAYAQGIRAGDVILSINGIIITSPSQCSDLLQAGSRKVTLAVYHQGSVSEKTLDVENPPPDTAPVPSPFEDFFPGNAVPEIIFEDDFTDNRHRWKNAVNQNDYIVLRQGRLVMKNQSTKYFYYAGMPIRALPTDDLTITGRLRKTGGAQNGSYGLLICTDGTLSCAGFKISGDRQTQAGITSGGEWFAKSTWQPFDIISPEPADNDLTIVKTGTDYFFFINDEMSGYGADFIPHGNTFALVVDPGCEMGVDWLRVSKGISDEMRARIEKGKADALAFSKEQPAMISGRYILLESIRIIPDEVAPGGLFDLTVDYRISDPDYNSLQIPFDFTWEILENGRSLYHQTMPLTANRDLHNSLTKKGLKAGTKPGAYTLRVTIARGGQNQSKEIALNVR